MFLFLLLACYWVLFVRVVVRVFLDYRDRVGWSERVVELPSGSVLEDLLRMIGLPEAVEDLRRGRGIALINGRNVLLGKGLGEVLRDGDVVALFPPAGGG